LSPVLFLKNLLSNAFVAVSVRARVSQPVALLHCNAAIPLVTKIAKLGSKIVRSFAAVV
jgi:hypothetical protein